MIIVKNKYFQTKVYIGNQNVCVDACIIIKYDDETNINIPVLIIRCLDVIVVISLTKKTTTNERLILLYRDFSNSGLDADTRSYKKFMYFIGKMTQSASFNSKYFDRQTEELHMKNVIPSDCITQWKYDIFPEIIEQVISRDVQMYLQNMTE